MTADTCQSLPWAPIDLRDIRVLADGLDHPEGVASGPDGEIWAGGEAGQLYALSASGAELKATTGGFLLGLAVDGDGRVYACDNGRHEVVRIDPYTGTCETYADPDTGRIEVPNYPVFAEDGTLYVSDSGGWDTGEGRLWRIEPGGRAVVMDVDLPLFPNGLALSGDGRWLYVAMSQQPGVVRVRVPGPGEAPTPAPVVETVVDLPGTVPDGLAFAADGTLLVACYAPDRIIAVSPDGVPVTWAEDPRRVVLASPTNLAFCGPTRSTLVIGSLARWHVGAVEVSVPGQPLHHPRGIP